MNNSRLNKDAEQVCRIDLGMYEFLDDVKIYYAEMSCGCTVALANVEGVDTVEPKYCPNCGAKVVD